MKKCCIIGAFGFSDLKNATGGQPVKTRELYDLLKVAFGSDKVVYVETYQWKRNPIRMLSQLFWNVLFSDVVIALPAQNGIVFFSKLLQMIKRKKMQIHYDVIGGWLPERIAKDAWLLENLKKFDGIWVETNSMEKALRNLGLENVTVIPNFKKLNIIPEEEIQLLFSEPYPLCTFSRVMEEKGISDAIEVVQQVNKKLGRTVFTLDIFGPVASEYEGEFFSQLKHSSEAICYKGIVPPYDSVQTVKNYFALLFPTYYVGEGFAGTLLDAMAAGVPVIASDWKYNPDIVKNGKTGVLFQARDRMALEEKLQLACENPECWIAMRAACREEAKRYTPEVVLAQITDYLEGEHCL